MMRPDQAFRLLLLSMGYAPETLRPEPMRDAATLIAEGLRELRPDDATAARRADELATEFERLREAL